MYHNTPDVANKAALKILGNDKKHYLADLTEELPREWKTFNPEGYLIPLEKLPLARAIRFGEYSKDIELIIERPDGSRRNVLVNGAPIRDHGGNITAGIVVLHDITERKKAQQDLRERESTLRSILSSTPTGILMVIDRTIQWANNRLYELIGYNREELIGKKTSILYDSPAEFERTGVEIYEQIREFGVGTAEARFRDKAGNILYVMISGMMRDINSPEKGFVFSVLDNTQKKLIEQKSARTQARFRGLYENARAGIIMTDLNAKIIQANQAFAEMMGYSATELHGIDLRKVTHREDLSYTEQVIKDLSMGTLRTQTYEKKYIRKDNSFFYASVTASSICDSKGNVESLMAVILDISQSKNTELALQKALTELEELKSRLEEENVYLRNEIEVAHGTEQIIGKDESFLEMLNQVKQVAHTDATVLIAGETGVGKELVASDIHLNSHRSEKPMIRVNCASIPHDLFESEFFGHIRGSFTGAIADRTGRFELANGGTLFLDEVGEIPMHLQSKLLRVLQEGEYVRIGEEKTRTADVRIIAATNRDIELAVEKGQFREDLYYRLSVFPIKVPPLRERLKDIPELADYFLSLTSRRIGVSKPALTAENLEQLYSYHWPGNIRELQNIIERAVITSLDGRLRFALPKAHNKSDNESHLRKSKFKGNGEIIKGEE